MKNNQIFIIDTSAILSGKPINIEEGELITTNSIKNEIKPGGRDYRVFQFLIQKGLKFFSPTKNAVEHIINISKKTGDYGRLSKVDIEIISLSYDLSQDTSKEIIIISDDYSIQNVANYLKIKIQNFNQEIITKRFKWISRCKGCGKKFKENINTCPICGSEIKRIVIKKEKLG
jgi:UPF0271 protein